MRYPDGHSVEFIEDVYFGDRVNADQMLVDDKAVKAGDEIPIWLHYVFTDRKEF